MLFLLAWQVSSCLSAQTFNRNYGQAFPWTEVTAGRTIERGSGYFTLYHQDQGNTYNAFITLQAIDTNGDTLFTRRILDTQHPASILGFEASRTSSGAFGSGLKRNFVPLPYTHSFLVRYDVEGDTLWYREYSNSDSFYNFIAGLQIALDSADNVVQLGSTTHDLVAPYDDQPAQIYLMKTDAQGNRLWDHTYGDPAINEQPQDHVQLPDGGFLIAGYSIITVSIDPFVQAAQPFLLRTDSIGIEEWYTTIPDLNMSFTSIAPLTDGGYIVVGGWCPNTVDTCGGLMVKMDANGNIQWQRLFSGMNHCARRLLGCR